MSNNNFSRRRRGMRFRPKGGLGQSPQKTDREAIQARADVVSEQGGAERVFEKRHAHEIERAENLAAGLVADFHGTVPARPVAGLFWKELHGFCFAQRHAGEVAKSPATAIGR